MKRRGMVRKEKVKKNRMKEDKRNGNGVKGEGK